MPTAHPGSRESSSPRTLVRWRRNWNAQKALPGAWSPMGRAGRAPPCSPVRPRCRPAGQSCSSSAHLDEADDAVEDLDLFDAAGYPLTAQRFGALEVLPGESGVSLELLAERLGVVQGLTHNDSNHQRQHPGVIVAPIQALMQSVPRPEAAAEFTLSIERGGDLPPGQLFDWLDRAGYTRNDAIDQPGDFAVRGGIIDLHPPAGRAHDDAGNPAPYRPGPPRLLRRRGRDHPPHQPEYSWFHRLTPGRLPSSAHAPPRSATTTTPVSSTCSPPKPSPSCTRSWSSPSRPVATSRGSPTTRHQRA